MTKSKKVTILLCRVGQEPQTLDIDNTLEAMQGVVGGLIEMVPLAPHIDIVCNEEGKLLSLPLNRMHPQGHDVICGDMFISRSNAEGETVSLTKKDIEKYTKQFALH